jgi:hypothetical protein
VWAVAEPDTHTDAVSREGVRGRPKEELMDRQPMAERFALAAMQGDPAIDHNFLEALEVVDAKYSTILERLSVVQQATLIAKLATIVRAAYGSREDVTLEEMMMSLENALYGFQLGYDYALHHGPIPGRGR